MQDSGSQFASRLQSDDADAALHTHLLAELLSLEDWTVESLAHAWPKSARQADLSRADSVIESTLRALYTNRMRHAVLCGEPSIGKTELVKLLARQIADDGVAGFRLSP